MSPARRHPAVAAAAAETLCTEARSCRVAVDGGAVLPGAMPELR